MTYKSKSAKHASAVQLFYGMYFRPVLSFSTIWSVDHSGGVTEQNKT